MTETTAPLSPAPTRRELTRAYKQAPPRMGVYAIRNLVSGHVLVGGSPNVDAALNRHRFELAMKHHRCASLQQDWLREGAANFRFEIIDRVKPRDDPAHDYRAELEALLVLWREEFDARGDLAYDAPPSLLEDARSPGPKL